MRSRDLCCLGEFSPKTTTAAGRILRQYLEVAFRYEDVIDGHLEEGGQGEKVIHAGKGLTLLPFVDGLRRVKTEVFLDRRNRQAARLPKKDNILAGSHHVDDGKGFAVHTLSSLIPVGRAVHWAGKHIYHKKDTKSTCNRARILYTFMHTEIRRICRTEKQLMIGNDQQTVSF